MNLFDHLLVILIIIVFPLYEYFIGVDRMKMKVARDSPGARLRIYWEIIILEWLVVAVLITSWIVAKRTASDLGLSAPGVAGFWNGAGLMTLGLPLMLLMQRARVNTPERRDNMLKVLNDAVHMIPRNRREMTHWGFLSLTAGICEEIIYRGFLIWYALQFLPEGGLGTTLAVVLPALFFGIGHLYQGPRGMIQVFFSGIVLGGVYVLTGSLWIPMITHIAIDIAGGLMSLYLHSATGHERGAPSNKGSNKGDRLLYGERNVPSH